MSQHAHRPATYDDILALPEHMTGEIIDGELFVSPRPASRHSHAATGITGDVWGRFQGKGGGDSPGGWWILAEPELHLGRDVFVPDIAGWRRENMPIFPDVAAIEVGPDWVCEVLSPSNQRHDRLHKMPAYAHHVIPWLWLVDPVERLIEVFRLGPDGHWIVQIVHAEGKARLPPFDAVEIDVDRWWPEEPAKGPETGRPAKG